MVSSVYSFHRLTELSFSDQTFDKARKVRLIFHESRKSCSKHRNCVNTLVQQFPAHIDAVVLNLLQLVLRNIR